MKRILKADEFLWICSMGKRLRVTAIFTDDAEANDHMARSDDAVIAYHAPFILLANKYDSGQKL